MFTPVCRRHRHRYPFTYHCLQQPVHGRRCSTRSIRYTDREPADSTMTGQLQRFNDVCQTAIEGALKMCGTGKCGTEKRRTCRQMAMLFYVMCRPTARCLFLQVPEIIFFCARQRPTIRYTKGDVTSQSLWSRYDRRFVGITRYSSLSQTAKIYRVTGIKLNQCV